MARKTKAAAKKASNTTSPLAAVEQVVEKIFKTTEMIVTLDPNALTTSLPHCPTGSFVLNYLIGGKLNDHGVAPCPGFPGGRITQLYGHPSSGKTTVALTTCGNVCAAGGTALYVDWENEVVPTYAAQLGVPISDKYKFMLAQPDTLEAGLKVLWAAAASGVSLIVIDSVGAAVPEDIFNQKVQDQGKQARLALNAAKWSQFLPKFKAICRKSGTTVIGISQIRANPGAMGHGEKITVQGGNAWQFYSALRIKLRRVMQIKAKRLNALKNTTEDIVVAGKMRARIEKCKISDSQGAEQDFYIRWGTGIDNASSYIDIGNSYKLFGQKGSWYEWNMPNGEVLRLQGADKFLAALAANPEYMAMAEQQVVEALAKGDYDRSAPTAMDEDAIDVDDLVAGALEATADPEPEADAEAEAA